MARLREENRILLEERDILKNAAHPERFVKGRPQPSDLSHAVWINPPAKKRPFRSGAAVSRAMIRRIFSGGSRSHRFCTVSDPPEAGSNRDLDEAGP